MKSDIFKITVTACPDDGLGTLDGERMLTLYKTLERLYPGAEITVGITSGSRRVYAEDGDSKDHDLLLKVIEEHGDWI